MKSLPSQFSLPLLAALMVGGAHAATAVQHIAFNAEQITSLGITLANPRLASAAASGTLSAKVVAAPDAEWIVTAQTSGVVVRMPVTDGEVVTNGSTLVELRSAEAPQLAAELVQAESATRLARSERDRDRQLHREGIIAARRVQASEQVAASAEAQLSAVRMRFKLMGLSAAEAGNGRVLVRAPATATVLERLATPGQRVNEADPLLRLVDASRLMLELQVPVDGAVFEPGDLLALPDGRRATVRQAGWAASDAAQTVRVRASVPPGSSTLRPGQWVKVQRLGKPAAAWVLPATAVSRQDGGAVVFTRSAAGFQAVPVQVLSSDSKTATVSGALNAGAAVATTGTIAIKGAWLGHGGGE